MRFPSLLCLIVCFSVPASAQENARAGGLNYTAVKRDVPRPQRSLPLVVRPGQEDRAPDAAQESYTRIWEKYKALAAGTEDAPAANGEAIKTPHVNQPLRPSAPAVSTNAAPTKPSAGMNMLIHKMNERKTGGVPVRTLKMKTPDTRRETPSTQDKTAE